MIVRIGVIQVGRDIELEMAEGTDAAKIQSDVAAALGEGKGLFWLEDKKGRKVGVPVEKLAYVEVGSPENERKVGFAVG